MTVKAHGPLVLISIYTLTEAELQFAGLYSIVLVNQLLLSEYLYMFS